MYFSIMMDERTDTSDTTQLLIFIQGVTTNKFNIITELLSMESMKDTTIGKDLYERVSTTLEWSQSNLNSITTDDSKFNR